MVNKATGYGYTNQKPIAFQISFLRANTPSFGRHTIICMQPGRALFAKHIDLIFFLKVCSL